MSGYVYILCLTGPSQHDPTTLRLCTRLCARLRRPSNLVFRLTFFNRFSRMRHIQTAISSLRKLKRWNGTTLHGKKVRMHRQKYLVFLATSCRWTGENDLKTQSVDANFFENGEKKFFFKRKRIRVDEAFNNCFFFVNRTWISTMAI